MIRAVAVALGACVGLAAAAAEPETDLGTSTFADLDSTVIEEVVVTGSRIRRDTSTARESVLHVLKADRTRTGLTSLGDTLARLPVSGSSLSTRFNSSGNFGFPADGGGVAAVPVGPVQYRPDRLYVVEQQLGHQGIAVLVGWLAGHGGADVVAPPGPEYGLQCFGGGADHFRDRGCAGLYSFEDPAAADAVVRALEYDEIAVLQLGQ